MLLGCSSGSDDAVDGDAGAIVDAAEASTQCGPMPDNMDCADTCDGHIYGPSCVKGAWKCVYRPKEQCADVAVDVPCGPKPEPLKCTDPCTGQPYEPTCEAGVWGCRNEVPDGGCVKPEAGQDAGTFACGAELCAIGKQFCHLPTPPGDCPTPEAGTCPPGCPGCPTLPPSCDPIPGECADSVTCTCILKALCASAMNGMCQPTSGGLTAGCSGS